MMTIEASFFFIKFALYSFQTFIIYCTNMYYLRGTGSKR